jgi:hypothetical protein
VTDIGAAQIRRLERADAALYREIRLEALQNDPAAFGSTFERESAQPLSWFEAAIGRADIFGAFLDGKLAGIAGFSAREGSKQAHKGVLWAMYVRSAARVWVSESSLSRPFSTTRADAWRWFNCLS